MNFLLDIFSYHIPSYILLQNLVLQETISKTNHTFVSNLFDPELLDNANFINNNNKMTSVATESPKGCISYSPCSIPVVGRMFWFISLSIFTTNELTNPLYHILPISQLSNLCLIPIIPSSVTLQCLHNQYMHITLLSISTHFHRYSSHVSNFALSFLS